MRTIAIALTVTATMLLGAGTAQAGVLSSSGGIITYAANQGEKNDVLVETSSFFGGSVPVYTFKDADANPITIVGGPLAPCEFFNGIAACRQEFVGSLIIDVRDRDDTAQVAETVGVGALMIGGRGNDTLMGGIGGDILKGNDNRDSLRGRGGADTYKAGRGRDNLQTLDGLRDTFISCGDGSADVVRRDVGVDPRPLHCEFKNRNPSKPH
jgi:Ca2+-binding RTX toxin-like protein